MTVDEASNPDLHQSLIHLTRDQVNEVIQLYYDGVKIDEIAEAYQISLPRNDLVSVLPPSVSEGSTCPYCDLPMWEDRMSRSWSYQKKPYCPNCGHSLDENCSCAKCQALRKEAAETELERKRHILLNAIDLNQYQPVSFDALALTDRVYLGAVLRAALSEDMEFIKPFDSADEPIAPTKQLQRDVFDRLKGNHAVELHPRSPIDSFADVEDDGSFRYYIYRVHLHLNVDSANGRDWVLDQLMNPPRHESSESEEVLALWQTIAMAEALEYLLYNMEQVGFDFGPGKKTRSVIGNLLSSFSTAQIYGIIWSSVTQATRYYQEGRVPRKQAANSVITNCQRYGEKALTEGWNLKHFNRIKECPQTALSKLFYNRTLGIGDSGFSEVPRTLYDSSG